MICRSWISLYIRNYFSDATRTGVGDITTLKPNIEDSTKIYRPSEGLG